MSGHTVVVSGATKTMPQGHWGNGGLERSAAAGSPSFLACSTITSPALPPPCCRSPSESSDRYRAGFRRPDPVAQSEAKEGLTDRGPAGRPVFPRQPHSPRSCIRLPPVTPPSPAAADDGPACSEDDGGPVGRRSSSPTGCSGGGGACGGPQANVSSAAWRSG